MEMSEVISCQYLASAASAFDWIPLNKLELQFYTICHLQHHAGELCDRLGREAGIDVAWVGMVRGE